MTIEQKELMVKALTESLPANFSDLMAMATEQNPEVRRVRAAVEMAQADLDEALGKLTLKLKNLLTRWETLVPISEELSITAGSAKETADDEQLARHIRDMDSVLQALTQEREKIIRLVGSERGGRSNRIDASGGVGPFAALAQPRILQPRPEYEEGAPENLREILEGNIGTTFEDVSLMVILDFISDTYEINITVDLAFTPPTIRQIDLKNVPMRSALLALTDKMGDACFVIRDYGLFLTTRDRAKTLAGPTIPDDVPYFAPVPAGQLQGGFGFGGGGFGGGFGGGGQSGGGVGSTSPPNGASVASPSQKTGN